MPNISNLRKKITEAITLNRLPKLVCLLLAILVWMVVEYVYMRDGASENWDLNDVRLSMPE